MKLPSPELYDGITLTNLGKYKSTEDGYTVKQVKNVICDKLDNVMQEISDILAFNGVSIQVEAHVRQKIKQIQGKQ